MGLSEAGLESGWHKSASSPLRIKDKIIWYSLDRHTPLAHYPFLQLVVDEFHDDVVLEAEQCCCSLGDPWFYGVQIDFGHVNLKNQKINP